MLARAQNLAEITPNNLRFRYVFALFLIALLILVSQGVMQFSIEEQTHDSRIVNISGRQRMLSQKITKICYYIASEETAERRQMYHGKLKEALTLWERSHVGLLHGDIELGLPGKNSAEVKALFASIESNHQAMVKAAMAVLEAPDKSARQRQAIYQIRDNETSFLQGMDAIVFLYDAEAKQRVNFAKYLELGLAAITLLVLFLEARFIFAPAIRRLRFDMQERKEREVDMDTLFSASPSAMFLIDKVSFLVIRCNHKAEELMGCATRSLIQRPVSDFLDRKHEINRSFFEKLDKGESLSEYEVLLVNAHSSSLETLVSSSQITFGDRQVLVLGVTNITELKKAQQILKYYATFDEMTGLVNRRAGLMLLDKAVERAKRDRMPLTVCYADLDGLKAANDKYGHHEGDWMIKTLSRVLTDLIRKGDVAMRLGGDEFMLVLHDCPESEARLLSERIEKRLDEISSSERKPFPFKVSFGSALYEPTRHTSAAELIEDADNRMYEVKQSKKLGRPL